MRKGHKREYRYAFEEGGKNHQKRCCCCCWWLVSQMQDKLNKIAAVAQGFFETRLFTRVEMSEIFAAALPARTAGWNDALWREAYARRI